jgi:curved DNA-binding protein CbpA
MPDEETTKQILTALHSVSYYEILKVPSGASVDIIKEAFQEFALEYHPDRYVDESAASGALAAEIFKRGTEAFTVLTDPKLRPLYDDGLLRGQLRYAPGEAAKAAREAAKPTEPRTLEDLAQTPKGKVLARKADRCVIARKYEEARVHLANALIEEGENPELKAQLDELWTMGGFELL